MEVEEQGDPSPTSSKAVAPQPEPIIPQQAVGSDKQRSSNPQKSPLITDEDFEEFYMLKDNYKNSLKYL